jgi:transcription antitermination factor NusG
MNMLSEELKLCWFPMRIFHSSAKRQNELNEALLQEPTVERTYVARRLVDAEEMTYVNALDNYIFIRIRLKDLRDIKANKAKYDHLRYVMYKHHDKDGLPITEISRVPNKQMEDFIRVIENANEQVIQLENMEFAFKPGQKVIIRKGPFEGVEGILKSIKKHLCVVVPIQGVAALAITNVPKKWISLPEQL